MSLFRAFLEVHIEAEDLGDAYNRIGIHMMQWPARRWRYANIKADEWMSIETSEPHFAPEHDPRP